MADLSEIRSQIAFGDKRNAQRKLARLLNEEPTNVDAWLLMAQVVDDVPKKTDCYKKVLEIDPENATAKDRLGWLYSQPALTPEFEKPTENLSRNNLQAEEVLEPLGGLPELPKPIHKKRRSMVKPKRWVILSSVGLALGILIILALALLPSPIPDLSVSRSEQITTQTRAANFTAQSPQSTGTTSRQVPDVRIVFSKDGQLWLWSDGEAASISPTGSEIMGFEVSPDGKRIALIRDGNLWLMGSQGGNAKQIVYSSLLPRVEQAGSSSARKVCHIVWGKDSSVIYFNSCSEGIEYYDLHSVTIQNSEVLQLLPDGEGGIAYPSPNGKWVVSVSPEEIHLTNMESLESVELFLYDKVLSTNADQWLVPVVWSNDSSFIYTAIPPVSSRNKPGSPVRIWKIDIQTNLPLLITELFPQGGDVIFSPQPNRLLFFFERLNQEAAELHGYDYQNDEERLLSTDVIHPVCLTQDGKEYAAFKAGGDNTLLTGTIGDPLVTEARTGINKSITIEHATCLGNGYVLVDGHDDRSSGVWMAGQGMNPILIFEVPLERIPQYRVIK